MITLYRSSLVALAPLALAALAPIAAQDMEAMRKRYAGRQVGLDRMSATPEDHGRAWEQFRVENTDGTIIASWWLPADDPRASAVMVHGFNMNKSHMLSRAEVLLEAGVNVALVDLRARGESGGELTSPGPSAATDVTPVLAHVRAKLAPALPVLLYGFSHGARTVLFAAKKDGAHAQAPLAGVIAEGPPYSLRESFMRKMKSNFAPPIPEGDLVGTCEGLGKLPLLVLVGALDEDLTAEQAEQLVSGSNTERRRVEIFENTGHAVLTAETDALYRATLHGFVEAVFRTAPARVEQDPSSDPSPRRR